MDNKQYAAGLRKVADFLEAHTEVGHPEQKLTIYASGEKLLLIARELGSFEKLADETFFNLQKDFEGITVEWFAYRSDVCKRVSKGIKVVPETVIPAKPTQVIAAHEIEEFEWECPESLLSKEASA